MSMTNHQRLVPPLVAFNDVMVVLEARAIQRIASNLIFVGAWCQLDWADWWWGWLLGVGAWQSEESAAVGVGCTNIYPYGIFPPKCSEQFLEALIFIASIYTPMIQIIALFLVLNPVLACRMLSSLSTQDFSGIPNVS